jgi:hypothetical protein
MDTLDMKITVKVTKDVSLQTPAGPFGSCIRFDFSYDDINVDFWSEFRIFPQSQWFAPGYGLVQETFLSNRKRLVRTLIRTENASAAGASADPGTPLDGRNVAIVVPARGNAEAYFLQVAERIRSEVYDGHATIIKALAVNSAILKHESVLFYIDDGSENGKTFEFAEVEDPFDTVIVLSAARYDGPNLAFGTAGIQPWKFVDPSAEGHDATAGWKFWSEVGRAVRPDGKIILRGSLMGAAKRDRAAYARIVAAASGRVTYACPERDEIALKRVPADILKVETGGVPASLLRFQP